MNRTILVGLSLLIGLSVAFAASSLHDPILIKTTRLIDVRKGSIANDQAILIEDGMIVEIGPTSAVTEHAPAILPWVRTRLRLPPALHLPTTRTFCRSRESNKEIP